MGKSRRRPGVSARPTRHQRWLAELKRRSIFRVVAVYGAVSFVILQAVDIVFPAIPLPAWTNSLVVWLVILGFPIALVLAWAFELTPEGVRRTEAATKEEIAAIVGQPARKRWPSGFLALLGILLLAAGFWSGRRSRESGSAAAQVGADGRPAIAVLPFADMSPEGDQAYFSDGISEEILTVLSRIKDLKVAARSSAFSYRGEGVDLRRVGSELGVPYLLAGSVRKSGDRLRITVELVAAADGLRVWAETYDRRLADVFAIQTEIAEAVATALRIPLGLAANELAAPTVHVRAHELYLTARAALRARGRGVGQAISLFEQALALDSAWAPAWAGLAEAHAIYPMYAGPRGESADSAVWATHLDAAALAARRALELDPRNASARIALGGVYRDRWEWAAAEAELLHALGNDPDNAEAHVQYAELLWGVGRLDEALRETGLALALDQLPLTYDVHGFVMYMNSCFAEAEALLEEGIARDSAGDMHFLRTLLANQLLLDGRYRIALDRFAEHLPDTAAYRRMGEALETRDTSRLANVGVTRGLAQTWMLLGQPDRALDVLEAMAFRLPFRVQYEIWDPHLEPLWDTPRFRDVVLPQLRLDGVTPRFARAGASVESPR